MKLIRNLAVSAVMLGATVFGVSSPASAATICYSGEMCAWPSGSLSGVKITVSNYTTFCWAYPSYGYNFPELANNSNYTVDVWDGNNCTGRHGVIYPNSQSSNMGYWSSHIRTLRAH